MQQQGLKVISLQDKGADGQNIPLAEVDPFTFLASFNRGVTDENRTENWKSLKTQWDLKAPVPDDFTGIPTLNNVSSWLFPYLNNLPEGKLTDSCEVILLYPTVDLSLSASYTDRGRRIRVCTINLNQPWQGIYRDLLSLVT
jgi:hypothetical protein